MKKHHLEKPLLRIIQRLHLDPGSRADTPTIVFTLNNKDHIPQRKDQTPQQNDQTPGFSRNVVEPLLDDMERRGYITKEFRHMGWHYSLCERGEAELAKTNEVPKTFKQRGRKTSPTFKQRGRKGKKK